MREIRFRGIDTMTGQWRFGDLVHNMKVTLTGTEPRVMVGGYEVRPETVGQFTGLKDTEGNEIYEGDILRLNKRYHQWVVVEWDDDYLMYVANRANTSRSLFACSFYTLVAGNIHQNSELLDKNEEACL